MNAAMAKATSFTRTTSMPAPGGGSLVGPHREHRGAERCSVRSFATAIATPTRTASTSRPNWTRGKFAADAGAEVEPEQLGPATSLPLVPT